MNTPSKSSKNARSDEISTQQKKPDAGLYTSRPHVTITRLVMPGQANFHGSLFGGVALSLMDEAAAILATRVAQGACVTAHIASVDFQAPIWVGEAVDVTAELIRVGKTSMRMRVSTVGENLATGVRRPCTEAEFVMVATDPEGHPRPVPKPRDIAPNADGKNE